MDLVMACHAPPLIKEKTNKQTNKQTNRQKNKGKFSTPTLDFTLNQSKYMYHKPEIIPPMYRPASVASSLVLQVWHWG